MLTIGCCSSIFFHHVVKFVQCKYIRVCIVRILDYLSFNQIRPKNYEHKSTKNNLISRKINQFTSKIVNLRDFFEDENIANLQNTSLSIRLIVIIQSKYSQNKGLILQSGKLNSLNWPMSKILGFICSINCKLFKEFSNWIQGSKRSFSVCNTVLHLATSRQT